MSSLCGQPHYTVDANLLQMLLVLKMFFRCFSLVSVCTLFVSFSSILFGMRHVIGTLTLMLYLHEENFRVAKN